MQAERTLAAGWSLRFLAGLVLLGHAGLSSIQNEALAAGAPTLEFNRDIRPILAENCLYCHGQDANKRQADLRLDVRDAAIEAGAIVPNDPVASEVILRINSSDPKEQMPPPKSRRLSAEQKQRLERWIAEGARYAPHWAFVAPGGRPSPLCGKSSGCATPSTVSCSPSSKPKGCHTHPRPAARPSSSGSRSTLWACRPRPRKSMPSSPTTTPRPTKTWSTACSRARVTANGWLSPGSTPPATPTAMGSSRTATPGNGSGATGWSRP